MGIKQKVDIAKKRLLICHSAEDKILGDVIHKMLSFNDISDEFLIYTSSDHEECRIPDEMNVFDYLRTFFIESYSDEKIYVVFVTSETMAKAWFPVTEVGAGWITRSKHKVFNVKGHTPQKPLDTETEWHTSEIVDGAVYLTKKEFDKFVVKIRNICEALGFRPKSKDANKEELKRYVKIE